MRCPHCQLEVQSSWNRMYVHEDELGRQLLDPDEVIPEAAYEDQEYPDEGDAVVVVDWMRCPNDSCSKPIVNIWSGPYGEDTQGVSWIGYPRYTSNRSIDSKVPDPYKRQYMEAASLLELSASASAAISRRILADVLEEFGGYGQFKLSERIDSFIKDTNKNPRTLRENLHYLREIADFAVHTQKDSSTQTIIDVEPGEAEWTLDILDDLFEHYIVAKARHNEMRKAFDAKIARANRKPITPLPADDEA